jgi:ATP-dependent helicase HrpB
VIPLLPIDSAIPGILAKVRESRAVVVTAAPGAGKTTRVPPALAVDGPVIVLQPRRVAARSLAARIAVEQRWTLGHEVGWHVRFERRFGPATRVLLATEGILTARLQQDPLLGGFRTIILDEFHERSVHADLGIALAKQAWLARSDLRLVIMSATLDAAAVSSYLDDCPLVDVAGTSYPLDLRYAQDQSLADAVATCVRDTSGQILCFLPGAAEIGRAHRDIVPATHGIETVELHGSLDAAAQDAAIAPSAHRRVILSTNIAETSLTVPGVAAVVDAGFHKVARYDPERAVDSLETERISQDSADQRSGRAARLGPGVAIRLWHERDRLRARREPEIQRVDLSATVLDILAWGGDPKAFDWFEPPPAERIDRAFALLGRLGATRDGRLTGTGRHLQRLPLHPRLSAILLAAGGAREAAIACAVLSERHYFFRKGEFRQAEHSQPSGPRATTTSDLLSIVESLRALPQSLRRTTETLRSLVREAGAPAQQSLGEAEFNRAILAGYPDRVARRREPRSPRVLLSSGHGAVVGPESGVRDGEFLVALDVMAGRSGEGAEARIRMASAVERSWLEPTHTVVEHLLDPESGSVRAVSREYYDALILVERPAPAEPGEVERLLVDVYLSRPVPDADEQTLRRMRFAGLDLDARQLAERAARGIRALRELELERGLTADERRRLDQMAPPFIGVPSGRDARLDYQADGSISAAVKLQELFGLADTPQVGPRRVPVLLALLAPNGRPVQMTRDLRSFWTRTYPEVRKELRARYPKHPWPEDPWTATPTARTKKRGVK